MLSLFYYFACSSPSNLTSHPTGPHTLVAAAAAVSSTPLPTIVVVQMLSPLTCCRWSAALRCSSRAYATSTLGNFSRRRTLASTSLMSPAPFDRPRRAASSRSFSTLNGKKKRNRRGDADRVAAAVGPSPSSPPSSSPGSPTITSAPLFDTAISFPTAATLVVTDGSAHISLAYCAGTVHTAVQQRLRSLLVKRCVAPLLSLNSFEDDAGEEEERRAGELAVATVAVQAALCQARRVAFFTSAPRLQHVSWAPLRMAYSRHLLASTSGERERGEEEEQRAGGAALVGHEGLVPPLFGAAARTTLLYVPCSAPRVRVEDGEEEQPMPPASPGEGAETPNDTAEPPSQAPPFLPQQERIEMNSNASDSPTNAPATAAAASLYWECFRVDDYMPSHVQLQAAVRHLLRERRPAPTWWTATTSPQSDRTGPERGVGQPRMQPLAILALVVPDHHIDIYEAFLRAMERERAAVVVNGADGGDAVQLLLFNSSGLVRVCEAA